MKLYGKLFLKILPFFVIVFSCKTESYRIKAVQTYCDKVIETGMDQWSGLNAPLLADGLYLNNLTPIKYIYKGESGVRGKGGEPDEWPIHNLANQQNFFRILVGLSRLTGDDEYKKVAEESIRYHFANLKNDEEGLLDWGGHRFIDLETLEPVGHAWRTDVSIHELKTVFPFYELMWQVDKQKTIDFIHSFWNAHIKDWKTLEFNRHGNYGAGIENSWGHNFEDPEPFFESTVLSFLNTGSDLIYSAAQLYLLDNDESALHWSKLLAGQYVKARHPETQLGAYQFSKPLRRKEPPEEGPLTGELTFSSYGDRAENQFGKDFPDVAKEGWAIFNGRGIYTVPMLMQMEISEALGEDGEEFLHWTIQGLKAFVEYGYDRQSNTFKPLWADGTDLTEYVFPRTGYYGKEGKVLDRYKADERFLHVFARAYRLSGDDEMKHMVRHILVGLGLSEQTDSGPKGAFNLSKEAENSNPYALFALLELYESSNNSDVLRLAVKIGDNILKRCFHDGFFLHHENARTVNFDIIEPLALLQLEATLRGKPHLVPIFSGGGNNLSLKTD